MATTETKLRASEINLIKRYCGRISDDDLLVLSNSLPQSVMGDRSAACAILQKDKDIDGWLAHASSADDWFSKVDTLGEFASLEMQERLKKSE